MLVVDAHPRIEFVEDIQTDLICTTIFSDLGAPKGVTGMLDWRLHGFISRSIVDQKISGKLLESVLIPLGDPFSSKRLFLIGLGSWKEYNSLSLKQILPKILQTLIHLHPKECMICMPRLLKENFKDETKAILTDFFTPFSQDIKVEIHVTNLA